jgi:hypothetical protein
MHTSLEHGVHASFGIYEIQIMQSGRVLARPDDSALCAHADEFRPDSEDEDEAAESEEASDEDASDDVDEEEDDEDDEEYEEDSEEEAGMSWDELEKEARECARCPLAPPVFLWLTHLCWGALAQAHAVLPGCDSGL